MYIKGVDKVDKVQDKRTHTTNVQKIKNKPVDRGFDTMYHELIDQGSSKNKFN